MHGDKRQLLEWIEKDRGKIINFLSEFIRAKSPNPPGDTKATADCVMKFLEGESVSARIIAGREEMPNVVAVLTREAQGRCLALNGHMDVFPVADSAGWTHDPWAGKIAEGKLYGRGACDMKCGVTASLFAFIYMRRMWKALKGSLALSIVSDEETFGPWGAAYVLKHCPETLGDCCLNGEPSGAGTLRFGERGLLWLRFMARTSGAHGAYTHLSASAIKIAARLIADLESLTGQPVAMPEKVAVALKKSRAEADLALGRGGADTILKTTVNIGSIRGGVKVNMIPSECVFECDLRLPPGVDREQMLITVRELLEKYPEVSMEEIGYSAPNWSNPDGEMAQYIRNNVKEICGFDPKPIVSLGGSDLRLWRARGVDAYYYGPTNHGMGTVDEYVEIEELLNVVRAHTFSAYDYLSR